MKQLWQKPAPYSTWRTRCKICDIRWAVDTWVRNLQPWWTWVKKISTVLTKLLQIRVSATRHFWICNSQFITYYDAACSQREISECKVILCFATLTCPCSHLRERGKKTDLWLEQTSWFWGSQGTHTHTYTHTKKIWRRKVINEKMVPLSD